jgi:23S rRNA pseudouridine1911/1915/1917 synthase
MNDRYTFFVEKGQEGVRLDIWLARSMDDFSRSRVQQLIRAGLVTVNGRSVKESRKIKAGDQVEVVIPPPKPTALKPENIPLHILFEDDALLVIDKPAGMVVHPAPGHENGTLVNAVLFHCPRLAGIGGEMRPGIVHRLDRDTSGVMVVAKTAEALAALAGQFKRREIHKEYLAMVVGILSPPRGVIKTLIGRHAADRKKMSAVPKKGRPAVTRYETVEKLDKYSLVKLLPETGRTHQLRVHLAHIGHPVVGDTIYGRRKVGREPPAPPAQDKSQRFSVLGSRLKRTVEKTVNEISVAAGRQMLHARSIAFYYPETGKKMEFTAPVPEDMARLLNFLRKGR